LLRRKAAREVAKNVASSVGKGITKAIVAPKHLKQQFGCVSPEYLQDLGVNVTESREGHEPRTQPSFHCSEDVEIKEKTLRIYILVEGARLVSKRCIWHSTIVVRSVVVGGVACCESCSGTACCSRGDDDRLDGCGACSNGGSCRCICRDCNADTRRL